MDQCDVEPFHAAGQVHLAEVGLQIDLVDADRHRFDVPRDELELGRFIAAEDSLGGDGHRLGGEPRGGLQGAALRRTPGHFAILFQGLFEFAELLLQRVGDEELGQRGGIRAGVFRDQPPPGCDRVVPLLVGHVLLVHQQQDFGVPRVKRILGQEFGEELVGFRILLGHELVGRHEVLGIDDLPLHAAPILVGRILGQEIAPSGQGLGVVLLRLIGQAQHVLGVGQFLAVAAMGIGEELLQRGDRVGRAAAVEIALGDFQVGLARLLVLGEAFQEFPQGGGAQVQLLVVLRVGDIPGPRKIELRVGHARQRRIDILGQQVLPDPAGLALIAFGQAALAQAIAGLDIPVRVHLHEREGRE